MVIFDSEYLPGEKKCANEEKYVGKVVRKNGELHIELVINFFIKGIIVESAKVSEPEYLAVDEQGDG